MIDDGIGPIQNNARQVISIVRKMNGNVFCRWDQIISGDYMQMFVLMCTLMELQK